MGYQENGYYGSGNQPHPNDTAGNYSYWAGQNQRAAEQRAAQDAQAAASRAAQAQAAQTASQAAFRSSQAAAQPTSYSGPYAGSATSSSYARPYAGGYSRVSSGPAATAPSPGQTTESSGANPAHSLPWFKGTLVGSALGLLPFILTLHLYPSLYMAKIVFAMGLFGLFSACALREFSYRRRALAFVFLLLSYLVPNYLTFGPSRSFLLIYAQLITQSIFRLHL